MIATSRNARVATGEGLGSLPLFLSLFLLLLAFFILLNTISSVERAKSKQVLESVQDSFPSDLRGALGRGLLEEENASKIDNSLKQRLRGAFEEFLPLAEVTVETSGNPVFVEIPQRRAFSEGETALQPRFQRMMQRVSDVMRNPGEARRLDLQILFGRDRARAGPTMTKDRVIRRRMMNLINDLIAKGAPGPRMTIGIEPGDEGRFRMLFHVVRLAAPETEDAS